MIFGYIWVLGYTGALGRFPLLLIQAVMLRLIYGDRSNN